MRSPSRNASKLSVLKGEFQVLKGGQEREVKIDGLRTPAPKPIADPDLKAAGVAVTLLPPEDGDDESLVRVRFTGPSHVITRMNVVNQSGKSIESDENGPMTTAAREGRVTRFHLRHPPDETARLTLRVLVGQEVVTIPFHLENIPLP